MTTIGNSNRDVKPNNLDWNFLYFFRLLNQLKSEAKRIHLNQHPGGDKKEKNS
jgi:hypothetical protein